MKRISKSLLLAFFISITFSDFIFAQTKISEAEIRVSREKFVEEAKQQIGKPYKTGAVGPDSFDCSGLIYYCARTALKIQLPRTAKAIYSYVQISPDSKREPGDLVFFRTKDDNSISHVGIYIGSSEFISSISDGENSGVKISSLKSPYWKSCYAASGKFLGNSGIEDKTESKTDKEDNRTLIQKICLNGFASIDWSLFTETRFMPNFRGLSLQANAFYEGKTFSPGIGTMFRWNYGVDAFQLPILFSITAQDFVRVYAGPIFSIGCTTAPDTNKEISASIFPGILGVSFLFPSFTTKSDFKVQIAQDINYTVYNNTDGAALDLLGSASCGLEFSTGISVTFPISVFIR